MDSIDLPTDPVALLGDLSIRLLSEPLLSRWEERRHLPEVVRTAALLIDLDSALLMNGLSALVENSIGGYLPEIIAALDTVGAAENARALRTMQGIMAKHQITHAMMRADFERLEVHAITNFHELHGDAASAMLDELESEVSPQLYVNRQDGENPIDLLETYVALHDSELRRLIVEAHQTPPSERP